MRLDPTTFPLTLTRLPLACLGKISSDTPVITAGYSNPVRTVKTSVKRSPGPSSLIMCYSYSGGLQVEPAPLRQMQRNDDLVNQPNAGKWHDDSTEAVDQKVPAQQLASAHGLIPHTPKSQRHQSDNDYRIKDDRREYRALGRVQPHDVQLVQFGIHGRKHRRNDRKIFGNVIGDRKGG